MGCRILRNWAKWAEAVGSAAGLSVATVVVAVDPQAVWGVEHSVVETVAVRLVLGVKRVAAVVGWLAAVGLLVVLVAEMAAFAAGYLVVAGR